MIVKEKDKRYDPNQLYKTLAGIFGDEYDIRNNQFRINCFKCGDTTGDLEVNLLTGWFKCWTCGFSGRQLTKLFKEYLGYVPKVEEFVTEEELRRHNTSGTAEVFKEEVEEVSREFKGLPEEFIPFKSAPFTGKECFTGDMALSWLLKRMTFENVLKYRIGYCLKGKYHDRIVVPCYENDKVVYFSARSIANKVKPKYLNPEDGEYGGGGKSSVVFNIEGARKERQAVLCEGVFDAIHVGDDGVCIFGTDPSPEQIWKLRRGIDRVVVILDYDARVKSFSVSQRFLDLSANLSGLDVRCVVLPNGGDPDEYPKDTIRKLIQNSKPFSCIQQLESESLSVKVPRLH